MKPRPVCMKCPRPFNTTRRIYVRIEAKSKKGKNYTDSIPIGRICMNCKGIVLD